MLTLNRIVKMKERVVSNNQSAIEILMRENEKGLECVHQLGNAVKRIQADGFSFETFEQVVEAMKFIDTEIRQHSEKEEQYLSPLLDRHVHGSSQVMTQEHRELWKALSALRECVKDIEELRIHPTTIRDLIECSRSIVEILTNHINKENTVFFPMATRLLTPEEYDQFQTSIFAARSSISSKSVH
jgi:hemerythrin-like domain-containing protein